MTIVSRLFWRNWVAYYHFRIGEFQTAVDLCARYEADSGLHRLTQIQVDFGLAWAMAEATRGNVDRAHAIVDRLDALANPSRPIELAEALMGRAVVQALGPDPAAALQDCRRAMAAADPIGSPWFRAIWRLPLAIAHARLGEFEVAAATSREACDIVAGSCLVAEDITHRAIIAHCACASNLPAATDRVTELLGLARRRNLGPYLSRVGVLMSRVCTYALQNDIEAEYVGELITRLALSPKDQTIETWPWPIKIHSFGRFEIRCAGVLLAFSGKAPRKSLQLLEILLGAVRVRAASRQRRWPINSGPTTRGIWRRNPSVSRSPGCESCWGATTRSTSAISG